jgi:hypothetical protein
LHEHSYNMPNTSCMMVKYMLWMHHIKQKPKHKCHEYIPILWIRQIRLDYISAKRLCLENNILTFRKFCTLFTAPTSQGGINNVLPTRKLQIQIRKLFVTPYNSYKFSIFTQRTDSSLLYLLFFIYGSTTSILRFDISIFHSS